MKRFVHKVNVKKINFPVPINVSVSDKLYSEQADIKNIGLITNEVFKNISSLDGKHIPKLANEYI